MIVSMLSVFFNGSKMTRLLKHGMPGHTVEIVEVSWMENPWGGSSRCITLRIPPYFGACPVAWTRESAITPSSTSPATRTRERNRAMRGLLILGVDEGNAC